MAVAETTARALGGIQPAGADPAEPVFGLTGETLANRIHAAARAAGLGEDFSGHSGRIGMARRMVAAGGADRGGATPGPVEARGHGGPVYPGRGRRRGAEVADLASGYSAALIFWCGSKAPPSRKGEPARSPSADLDILILWDGTPASTGDHVAKGLVVFTDDEDLAHIVTLEEAAALLRPYLCPEAQGGQEPL